MDIMRSYKPDKMCCYRTVYPGEVLGYLEVFDKGNQYLESCVCKSQEGMILSFEKNKFMKKVMSADNSVD